MSQSKKQIEREYSLMLRFPDFRCFRGGVGVHGSNAKLGGFLLSWRLSMAFTVAYMLALLNGSCVPTDGSELESHHSLWFLSLVPATLQNFLHIPAYALLVFLWRWTLESLRIRTAKTVSLALTISFGVFQEWAQSLVPGRFASFYDVVFDSTGAAIGVWCFQRFEIWRQGRE